MPVRNAESHLPEALQTIFAQDWPNLELIAVDDGSQDRSPRILAEAARTPAGSERRMRILRQEGRGVATARNAGIAEASGEFILLADADDRCDAGLVSAGMAALARAPAAQLVFARCRYIDADGAVEAVQAVMPDWIGTERLLEGLMVNTPLLRRAAGEAVGWHDAQMTGSVDLDLFVRLTLRHGACLHALPEVLSDYRRSGGQITSDWRRMERTWREVRDKAVAQGFTPSRRGRSRMRGRHCAYWATLAYAAGEYRAAQRLIAEAAWRDPLYVMSDELARVRALACAAALLPAPLHAAIRARFNARRIAAPPQPLGDESP